MEACLTSEAYAELGIAQDDPYELPEDRGLHYPLDYLIRTWRHYRQHGTFPIEGGIRAQDPRWFEDIDYVTARYNRVLGELMQSRGGGGGRVTYDGATDWQSLMG